MKLVGANGECHSYFHGKGGQCWALESTADSFHLFQAFNFSKP